MRDIFSQIYSLQDQCSFVPEVHHKENLIQKPTVLICGMGGSRIAGTLLAMMYPHLTIRSHSSYGLPRDIDVSRTLIIISSYSGDTEEAIDAYHTARQQGIACAVSTRGGQLLSLAKEHATPHSILPTISIEPRFSLLHQLFSLLTLMGTPEHIDTLRQGVQSLSFEEQENRAHIIAKTIGTTFPLIYSSEQLFPIAYLSKACINESAKLPSFANSIPEANHNELQSLITNDHDTSASSFSCILMTSPYDHERIQKRLAIMGELYESRGFSVIRETIHHTQEQEVLSAIVRWYMVAVLLAETRDVDLYATPFIASFKQQLSSL